LGLKSGFGLYKYDDDSIYVGNMKDGKKVGRGMLIQSNKSKK